MNRELISLMAGLLLIALQATANPVESGKVDLREWDAESEALVNLQGKWDFYWHRFVDPGNPPAASAKCYVPNSWNNRVQDTLFKALGYGTYRLRILLPEKEQDLALYMHEFSSSYRAFANGEKIGKMGIPGTNRKQAKPAFGTNTLYIPNASDTLDLVFHVSNYRRDKAGFWGDIELGKARQVQEAKLQTTLFEMFLFASILVIGLYHLLMFINRQRDYSALFFAVFAMLIALRLAVTGEYLIYHMLPLNWGLTFRLEYISFYAAVPLFGGYIYSLYQKEFWKPLLWIVSGIGVLAVGVVLVSPFLFFISTVEAFQVFTVLFSVYVFYLMIRGIIRKQRTSYVLLAGFLIFFATVFNDMLYVNGVIETGSYSPWGLFVFIFSQAYLISWRYSRSFKETEKLSRELNEININLENRVEERTREIRLQNQEINSQREELKAVADNLQETNNKLNDTNETLSKKNQAITQSIQYAKRIQHALMPSDLGNAFADYFVFYRPRDIVSGDFYWIRRKRSKIFMVVADCTGHGVPGAFVSLLGITFLNEAMQQKILPDAKMMLELQRKNVKETLNKSDKGRMRRDGMDMAVCIIDTQKREINYAGAHMPLYMIKDGAFYNYKPDRMPVSVHHKEHGFQQHFIPYNEDTRLYLFSDGIVDQIGNGEKREKFKPRRLRELLQNYYQRPMHEQKQVLENTFYNWKEGYPMQVDDLMVLGLRLQ